VQTGRRDYLTGLDMKKFDGAGVVGLPQLTGNKLYCVPVRERSRPGKATGSDLEVVVSELGVEDTLFLDVSWDLTFI
jgi:hypothetical protein